LVVPPFALLSPEVLEAIWRQLGVAHHLLDIPMTEIGLQGPRIVALVGQSEATGVPQHMRVGALNPRPAAAPARSTSRANPAVAKGEPRSEVNTNGDLIRPIDAGSGSRAARRGQGRSRPRQAPARQGAAAGGGCPGRQSACVQAAETNFDNVQVYSPSAQSNRPTGNAAAGLRRLQKAADKGDDTAKASIERA
jgi:hypothetical protein